MVWISEVGMGKAYICCALSVAGYDTAKCVCVTGKVGVVSATPAILSMGCALAARAERKLFSLQRMSRVLSNAMCM